MAPFYITTPIFYVNGAPHIGHAYTALIADIFARHYRQRTDDVFFLTGTDEHGLKIQRSAEAQGMTPQQLADKNSQAFKDLFEVMNISYDRFIRTTEDDHKATVREMVQRLTEAGTIYEDAYEGWYSASDEAFYDESEVADGCAISSGSKVEWIKEPSYFFKLSDFQDKLLNWYDNNPTCIQPAGRFNEIRSFVASGLHDLSITRTTFDWGIPYPDDPSHVLYVWIDALTNYVSGIGGFADVPSLKNYWPANIHLIGKDILRFHAVYWPAFLMAADLELPKQVFAHGWWLNDGEKMSKSRNNFISAAELVERYTLDQLRYYFVREMPLGSDGNFVHARVAQRNNSELADNLGNLVNRSFAMTQKFCDNTVPDPNPDYIDDVDKELVEHCRKVVDEVCRLMDERKSADALELIMSLSSELNQYCTVTQPWALFKEGKKERLHVVLYTLLEGVAWAAILARAFIPDAAQKILDGLSLSDNYLLDNIVWGLLKPGTVLKSPGVLFQKFDMDAFNTADDDGAKSESDSKKSNKNKDLKDDKKEDESKSVTFNEFLRVEIRCGKIVEAERVEGADKLLKLRVDVGEDAPRQVVAGIAKSYAPDELVGLHVAVVTNLKPAKIFGIESRGMLLAADTTDGNVVVTTYPKNVLPGTRIS